MRFLAVVASALPLITGALGLAQIVSDEYESITYIGSEKFTERGFPVDNLTCGPVLSAEGYHTVGDIKGNPAGFANVTSADLHLCTKCATLQYAGAFQDVVIVDSGLEGFVVTKEAYAFLASANSNPKPPIDVRLLQVYDC